MTAVLPLSVGVAPQPFQQIMLHNQLPSADPQSGKIRAVQQVVCPGFGNAKHIRKLFCIHHIGHGFQWFSAHKSPSQHKKAATKNRDCLKCLVLSCVLVQEIAVLPGNEIFISPSQLLNALADCAGRFESGFLSNLLQRATLIAQLQNQSVLLGQLVLVVLRIYCNRKVGICPFFLMRTKK